MSLLVRPAIRIRSTGCFIHPESFRHFSIASRALLEAGKPQHASTATAMATHAPATGDQTSSSVKVVGAELPAAEGPHYQGQYLSTLYLDRTSSPMIDRSYDGDDGQRAHSPLEDRRLDALQSHLHPGGEFAIRSYCP